VERRLGQLQAVAVERRLVVLEPQAEVSEVRMALT
jgi:hypothetical protein